MANVRIGFATALLLAGAMIGVAADTSPTMAADPAPRSNPDAVVAAWTTSQAVPRDKLSSFLGWAHDLAFDPTGSKVVVRWENEIQTWSVGGKKRLAAATVPSFSKVHLAPDGSAYCVNNGSGVDVYGTFDVLGRRIGSYRPAKAKSSFTERFHAAGFGPDAAAFHALHGYSTGKGQVFRLHSIDPASGEGAAATGPLPPETFEHCRWLLPVPNSDAVLACCGTGGTAEIWLIDPKSRAIQPMLTLTRDVQEFTGARAVGLSPDGKWLALLRADKILIVDWRAGKRVSTLDNSYHKWCSCRFTPDGKRLVVLETSHQARTLSLNDAATGKRIAGYEVKPRELFGTAFAISRDGTRIGIAEQSIRLVEKDKKLVQLDEARVTVLDFERAFGVAPLPVGRGAK